VRIDKRPDGYQIRKKREIHGSMGWERGGAATCGAVIDLEGGDTGYQRVSARPYGRVRCIARFPSIQRSNNT
jgi:hypothetical protein